MTIRTALLATLLAGPALAGDPSPATDSPGPGLRAVFAPAPDRGSPFDGAEARGRAGWGGGYFGMQLSYGRADSREAFGEDASTGGFYGAITGYRLDLGRIVVGGEVSYDRTDVTFPNGTNVDNLLRAGASLGYDFGDYLPYVAGGYANASVANDPLDFDDTYHGGFYALGLSYRVTDRILIGAEAAWHRLDAEGIDTDVATVSGKIAYRF